jgi:hypothetical protein
VAVSSHYDDYYYDGGDDGTGAEGRNKINRGGGTDGPQDYTTAASMNFYHKL